MLRVDEKSQIQSLDRTAPMLPLQPGLPERRVHDYKRNGTTSLAAALEVATGEVPGGMQAAPPAPGVPRVPQAGRSRPPDRDVHLVMDNYAAHKRIEVGPPRDPQEGRPQQDFRDKA